MIHVRTCVYVCLCMCMYSTIQNMPGVDSFGFGAAPEQPTLDGFEEVPVTGGSTVATDSPSKKKKKKKAGEDGKIEAWRKKTIPLDHAGISEYLHFDCGTSSHLRHQVRFFFPAV